MARPVGKDFEERMKLLGEAIESGARQILADVSDAVQVHLIHATPVSDPSTGHSGRARNNWIASINNPSTAVTYNGPFEASGEQRISTNRTIIENNSRGRPVYITNNLNYIQALNDGYSAQAPAGFIQQGMLVGIQAVKGAKLMQYARVNWKRGKSEMGRLMVHSGRK